MQDRQARPISEAPRDNSFVWLLVDYSEGDHPLSDNTIAWTLGSGFYDGETVHWQFAGWCWQQDCFTEGVGKVIGWLPCDMPSNPPETGMVQ